MSELPLKKLNKIGKVIFLLCIIYNAIVFVMFLLKMVGILQLQNNILHTIYYTVLISWGIGVLTKFIPKEELFL